MFIASSPCKVRLAVSNEKKPSPGLTSRLIKRWSCSIRLLRYFTRSQFHAFRKKPSGFELGNGFGRGGILVDVHHTWSWWGCSVRPLLERLSHRLLPFVGLRS